MPERPKGTGCKPVGSAYGGSNPPAPITGNFHIRFQQFGTEYGGFPRVDAGAADGNPPSNPFWSRWPVYSSGVKQIATLRVSQVTAKYGEHAPMATACCNACRTCVQTNLVGIAVGAVAALGVGLRRVFTRR